MVGWGTIISRPGAGHRAVQFPVRSSQYIWSQHYRNSPQPLYDIWHWTGWDFDSVRSGVVGVTIAGEQPASQLRTFLSFQFRIEKYGKVLMYLFIPTSIVPPFRLSGAMQAIRFMSVGDRPLVSFLFSNNPTIEGAKLQCVKRLHNSVH